MLFVVDGRLRGYVPLMAISGVLVQPFRLFWYGENDVLVQRRPEVIST
jgi:hypothetical protein